MNIKPISKKEYISFYKSVYSGDRDFRDNKSPLFTLAHDEKSAFRENSIQELIGAVDNSDNIKVASLLIIHKNAPENLFIGFFEALPQSEDCVNLLLSYAEDFGRKHSCSKLVVGIDGHINNAVGFALDKGKASFSENLSKPYYHDYFTHMDRVNFESYIGRHSYAKEQINEDYNRISRVLSKFDTQFADLKCGLEETVRRYNALNNVIFAQHPYYYKREFREDMEMFKDFATVLTKENLIFATYKGKDVGFIFLYPDFNQNIATGEEIGIKSVIRSFFTKHNTIKIMEIGVLPEYRSKGIIVLLFYTAVNSTHKAINKIISSWIISDNEKSKSISKRYTEKSYKDFCIYEKKL